MSTPADILAKQAAYAARPYEAYVTWSHASGTFRFDTLAEAIGYVHDQWAHVSLLVRTKAYGSSWIGFDTRKSYVKGPDCGTIDARYILWLTYLDTCTRTH